MDEYNTEKNGNRPRSDSGSGKGRKPISQQSDNAFGKGRKPPFQFLTRLIPLAVIAVMLMLLLPHLKRGTAVNELLVNVEPPIGLQTYNTASDTLNTLLYDGLKRFGRKDYDEAARLLSKAYFFSTVKMRKKEFSSYPEDLRFYFGLTYFYRNQAAKGIPLLEEEALKEPDDEKYPWYLAHLYLAVGENEKAADRFQAVVSLGGSLSAAAEEKLEALNAAAAGR